MAVAIASVQSPSVTSHVVFRMVQPGSWQHCVHCHETIEFVPCGHRAQATRKLYSGSVLESVEHFHRDCYMDSHHPYGVPTCESPRPS